MKKYLVLSLLCLMLASCGKKSELIFVPAPTLPVATTFDAVQDDIDHIVSLKNEWRVANGQNSLVKGLMCQLFTYTSGDRIQSSIAGHNTLTPLVSVGYYEYNGLFNQPNTSTSIGNNILPEPFKGLYKTNYMVRCQGQIVIQDTDYYKFELASDDAALLYLNGSLVINNDNAHGITNLSNIKLLERGVYSFRIDYAQGSGDQAFILKMNGASIDPRLYYR